MEPWGTPVSALTQDEHCPVKTTLWFLEVRKSINVLRRSPDIPFCFSL